MCERQAVDNENITVNPRLAKGCVQKIISKIGNNPTFSNGNSKLAQYQRRYRIGNII